MSHAARLAREDAITDALRAANDAIGQEEPTAQALAIIAAIKGLRSDAPVRIASLNPVDYLERVQKAARAAWVEKHALSPAPGRVVRIVTGPAYDATAGVDTPLGRLRAVIWQRRWTGKRGERIAWAGEYYLNDEPITVAEIKAAGLAQRPTTRRRQKGRRHGEQPAHDHR